MTQSRQYWVQGSLFAPVWPAPTRRPRPAARSYSRVTSDPAVARSVEEKQRLAQSVKLGLARILAQRSEVEREQLRRLFGLRRVA
ncbi:MAG: hypothetical protein ACYC4L_09205 [Chloroflexota bacterium]